ncbi:LacI family DNA-binding transcriptional regulator [Phyllobacterium sp. YR531]|uniref:LacI family DNA-binding transcriptional regulator n=1 Tax=Phyllobacterium sp. YR531 TaxID=1144343 RepID=UPI00026FB1C5|nr:LacI family DNA-binding transcriptional regulator [Phyllobacterium sp. YR531]EJN06722.1 ABC-type sugar transport system, periplasmic component [Phyllobacterium sp. YR531]
MTSARIADIAREAGVGTTTVDRVLNDRGNVSAEVAKRVVDAATRLGSRRILPDAHRPLSRIQLLLPEPQSDFRIRLAHAFREFRNIVDRNLSIQIDYCDPFDAVAIARAINSSNAQAIAFAGTNDVILQHAVENAKQRGIYIATIIGDIPNTARDVYIGIDNRAAARTAVWLTSSRLEKSGSAVILTSGIDGAGLSGRIDGFRDALAQYLPGVTLAGVHVTNDDHRQCYNVLSQALHKNEDVVLVYNCGAANEMIGEVLKRQKCQRQICFIGHELTPITSAMLKTGEMFLCIDQNPDLMARRAIERMAAWCGFTAGLVREDRQVDFIPFTLHTRENC